jgi:hypothetical protein
VPAIKDTLEAADSRFDFGKFRHSVDMAERLQAR